MALRGPGNSHAVRGSDQRSSSSAVATALIDLHLSLLRNLQSIVDLGPEIPDGAFKLGVPEQQLNRPEISGPPVD
jgi:hypothetical protein